MGVSKIQRKIAHEIVSTELSGYPHNGSKINRFRISAGTKRVVSEDN